MTLFIETRKDSLNVACYNSEAPSQVKFCLKMYQDVPHDQVFDIAATILSPWSFSILEVLLEGFCLPFPFYRELPGLTSNVTGSKGRNGR